MDANDFHFRRVRMRFRIELRVARMPQFPQFAPAVRFWAVVARFQVVVRVVASVVALFEQGFRKFTF